MDTVMQLAGFDWIVVLIVGITAAFGLMRGFIAEVASLAAWAAGFIAVRLFYTPARAIFETASGSELIAAVAAVMGPFLIAVLLVKLFGSFLSNSAKGSVIGPVDRLLGLGFGLDQLLATDLGSRTQGHGFTRLGLLPWFDLGLGGDGRFLSLDGFYFHTTSSTENLRQLGWGLKGKKSGS